MGGGGMEEKEAAIFSDTNEKIFKNKKSLSKKNNRLVFLFYKAHM
jgi:hypothetical protein